MVDKIVDWLGMDDGQVDRAEGGRGMFGGGQGYVYMPPLELTLG